MKKLIILVLFPMLLGVGKNDSNLVEWKRENLIRVYDEKEEEWYTGKYKKIEEDLITEVKCKNGYYDGDLKLYNSKEVLGRASYKNGLLHGENILYYDNNKIMIQENYKDGLLDGETLGYYDDGQLMIKQNYKEGLLDGEAIEYYYKGLKNHKSYYKKGELLEKIKYNEDGDPLYKAEYKNGNFHGQVEGYRQKEELEYSLSFEEGLANGDFIFYDKRGRVEYKLKYKKNELVSGEISDYGLEIIAYFLEKAELQKMENEKIDW